MKFLSKIQSLFRRTAKPSSEEAKAIVEHLIELGFLKFVTEPEKASVRAQLVDSVEKNYLDSEWDDDCVSADKRTYSADAEELAEGSLGDCVLQMKQVLAVEGVTLESVEDDFGEERYQVMINGTAHLIYERAEDAQDSSWLQAHKRLIEIVNSLLEDAGSGERLFGIYCGGNEGLVMFLTTEMHSFLRMNSDIFDEGWMPVSASELA
jgi:hypothetical protein